MPSHCEPLKVAKRLWLKATALHDDATLRVLYPLFSSPACALARELTPTLPLRQCDHCFLFDEIGCDYRGAG
jgi:hypothetical protein